MTALLVAILVPRTRLGPALTVQARDLPAAGSTCGRLHPPEVIATHVPQMTMRLISFFEGARSCPRQLSPASGGAAVIRAT